MTTTLSSRTAASTVTASPIALGYGTYGMQGEDLTAAVTHLAAIGYQSIELCATPGWQCAPASFTPALRQRLKRLMQDLGLSQPVVMGHLIPLSTGEERSQMLVALKDYLQLAADLAYGRSMPVFTSVLGGALPPWETCREQVLESILECGRLAGSLGVVLALEPHAGGVFNHPHQARWLIDNAHSPNIRLNFDVSHFVAQRLDIPEAIAICAPRAAHIHVKDVIHRADGYDFALPGQTSFDYTDYFTRLAATGNLVPVVVEVSAQVWRKPDYLAWAAAEAVFCFLDRKRRNERQAAGSR